MINAQGSLLVSQCCDTFDSNIIDSRTHNQCKIEVQDLLDKSSEFRIALSQVQMCWNGRIVGNTGKLRTDLTSALT